jgi:hypothetical protein
MGVIILGCLTVMLLAALILVCIHCIKIEKNVLDITDIVERRVLQMYEVKK